MAYGHITSQDTLNTASAASVTTTFGGPVTAGNLLIGMSYAFGIGVGATTIPGWSTAATVSFVSAADETTILYKIATGTESAIQASASGATSMGLAIHEFSTGAIQSVQPLVDQTNTSSTASLVTTLGTGSITPTKPHQLVIVAMSFPTGGVTNPSFDSGATIMSSNGNMVDAFMVVLNTNSLSPTASWTGLSVAGGCIASFFVGSQGDILFPHLIVKNGISSSEAAN